MNEQEIVGVVQELAKKYQVEVQHYRHLRFDTPYGLPVLPFFLELSERLQIPIGKIELSHSQGGGGCDTCGYGGECDISFEIRRADQVSEMP